MLHAWLLTIVNARIFYGYICNLSSNTLDWSPTRHIACLFEWVPCKGMMNIISSVIHLVKCHKCVTPQNRISNLIFMYFGMGVHIRTHKMIELSKWAGYCQNYKPEVQVHNSPRAYLKIIIVCTDWLTDCEQLNHKRTMAPLGLFLKLAS